MNATNETVQRKGASIIEIANKIIARLKLRKIIPNLRVMCTKIRKFMKITSNLHECYIELARIHCETNIIRRIAGQIKYDHMSQL